MAAQQKANDKPRPIFQTLVTAGLWYGTWYTRPLLGTEDELLYFIVALLTLLASLELCIIVLKLIPRIIKYLWIMRPSDRAGTAGWCSWKEIKKAKLHRRDGFFLGLHECGRAIFAKIESSGLIVSPSGGGKTSCYVIPFLMLVRMSMLIIDLKCNLSVMTGRFRKKKFKHITEFLNPVGHHTDTLGPSAKYNPLIILVDDWTDPDKNRLLLGDAEAIAKRLYRDPPQLGENQYFRNGSRKYLAFAFVYLVITKPNPTLSAALELLCDHDALMAALYTARASEALNGDLARLAKDLITKIEQGDKRQTESFREGAVQSLGVFSGSGCLAENTSTCTFRFSDMKLKKMSIYIMADPTLQDVFAPWVSLIVWCAITELLRCPSTQKICFLLDEICNFYIEGLPKLMTLLREFQIIMWMFVQDLDQWASVYGPESVQVLLSQTEVKVFTGVRSLKTYQLISDMLGEKTIKTRSHNLGTDIFDPIQRSVQEGPRRLDTADEVRRSDYSYVFVNNLKPIKLEPIGYHQIAPMKRQVGINPLYGKKRWAWTRLRL